MRCGDNVATQKITGNDLGRDAIVQVLRRYFEHRVHAGSRNTVSANEALIVKALKSYFKGDAWPDQL
ncbi:MAG: hypothetical protein NTV99_10520 [Deltaproteobacteria bacterium]|nr:hypothetical protein [Deltaproteobacteria bacterium]